MKKKEKVIHVDKLTIHAKEVEIIQERSRGHHGDRRHPLDFFGTGRRLGREFEKEKHHEEESSSAQGKNERHRGPKWI